MIIDIKVSYIKILLRNRNWKIESNLVSDDSDPCATTQRYNIDALNETHNGGEIFSPNYPSSYPNSASCTWQIHAEQGQIVQFNFTEFDLETK